MSDQILKPVEDGLCMGASDITLCAGLPVVYRVEGRLVFGDKLQPYHFKQICAFCQKICSRTEFQNHDSLSFDHEESRFRFTYYSSEDGDTIELRVLPKDPRPLAELGAPAGFLKLLDASRGIIIVTGTTGSGKTTTLGGAIDQINSTQSHKIITLEDPVEIRHENKKSIIKHRELGRHFQSFPEAIRAAMRQDPDIILLGELRDPETMSAALTAAETGHLVFATAHTKDAAGCVSRVLDALPGSDALASLAGSFVGVLAQQLVPGIDGRRMAAFELLINTQAVRNCIREKRIDHIRDEIGRNSALGMVAMDYSLEQLVRTRRITKETALSFCMNQAELKRKLDQLPS
jgi:twitching motility protein PilT